jgi:hypothetical protein
VSVGPKNSACSKAFEQLGSDEKLLSALLSFRGPKSGRVFRETVFPDTDGDGLGDYYEVSTGTDPANPNEHTPPDIFLTQPAGATRLP